MDRDTDDRRRRGSPSVYKGEIWNVKDGGSSITLLRFCIITQLWCWRRTVKAAGNNSTTTTTTLQPRQSAELIKYSIQKSNVCIECKSIVYCIYSSPVNETREEILEGESCSLNLVTSLHVTISQTNISISYKDYVFNVFKLELQTTFSFQACSVQLVVSMPLQSKSLFPPFWHWTWRHNETAPPQNLLLQTVSSLAAKDAAQGRALICVICVAYLVWSAEAYHRALIVHYVLYCLLFYQMFTLCAEVASNIVILHTNSLKLILISQSGPR